MESRLLERYMIHYVSGEEYKGFINAHTHGLEEAFAHKDLQIVLPLTPYDVSEIMYKLVDMIDKGARFEPGPMYSSVLDTCNVEFMEVMESERYVLRLLIPDADCISPHCEGCEWTYRRQTLLNT